MATHTRDLVVVGASAGGVEALRAFVAGLPSALPAAIVVVLHLPAGGNSALASILARSGALPAVTATDGMPLVRGRIHVAPPDFHVLVHGGALRLSRGPTENGHRPAVDPLFRSASIACGPKAIGVVLSGALDDGSAGMVAIAARGGVVVVQDPREALFRSMPDSVLRYVRADHVLAARAMGDVLRDCIGRTVPDEQPRPVEDQAPGISSRSGFSCPDCAGALVESGSGQEQFVCRVGHAWTSDALLEAQSSNLERTLWTALRTLDEKSALCRRLRAKALVRGGDVLARRYERTEEESSHAAAELRRHLVPGTFTDEARAEHRK